MDKNFYNLLAKFFINDIRMMMNKYKLKISDLFEVVSVDEVFWLVYFLSYDIITRYQLKEIWKDIFIERLKK